MTPGWLGDKTLLIRFIFVPDFDGTKCFTDDEERGIIDIIDRYAFIGTALRLDLLASVANRTLRKKGIMASVGKH